MSVNKVSVNQHFMYVHNLLNANAASEITLIKFGNWAKLFKFLFEILNIMLFYIFKKDILS